MNASLERSSSSTENVIASGLLIPQERQGSTTDARRDRDQGSRAAQELRR